MYDIVKIQRQTLEQQLSELENARSMCERMLLSGKTIDYENLDIELYVADVKDYWNENRKVFKLDSVSFFYMWGGSIAWWILAVACLLVAVFSFGHLPAEIPIQWSGGIVSSLVDKKFIFAFPAACVIIRFILRPFIWQWLRNNIMESDSVTGYITNYLCSIALSVEVFITQTSHTVLLC